MREKKSIVLIDSEFKIIMKKIATVLLLLVTLFSYGQEEHIIPLHNSKKRIKEYSNRELKDKAEFIGGEQELLNFYKKNSKFKISPFEKHESSVVFILHLDEYGEVLNHEVLSKTNSKFVIEARRLIDLMPSWKPATLDGKPVKVAVFQSIFFE
ncbi:hypothetical protein U6A24_18220 [Aquimarina gracilis]|uniref:TonB-like protein n=1 Tax=Aquimarina gracilis TaxID=874422 RepID=A0ABU5ZZX8_9FLAO|nr:hypothetical protein [Aquimarina gracilis]MEB3347417.1 hypothetical protein [Aquimarina gracilis]